MRRIQEKCGKEGATISKETEKMVRIAKYARTRTNLFASGTSASYADALRLFSLVGRRRLASFTVIIG